MEDQKCMYFTPQEITFMHAILGLTKFSDLEMILVRNNIKMKKDQRESMLSDLYDRFEQMK